MKLWPGSVRILLDTNILISGMMRRDTPPGQLVDLWIEGFFEIVTGEAQLEELRRVLQRPSIAERVRAERAERVLELLASAAQETRSGPSVEIDVSPDPDDNPIIAIAISGRADLIVSGDKPGMLALHEVQGISMVMAREAVGLFERRADLSEEDHGR